MGAFSSDFGSVPIMCVVRKPIYGMAQAGRRWQRSLFPWLIEFGFTQCESDKCVFILTRTMDTPDGPREETVIIGVYVDDLQIAYGPDDEHSLHALFTTAMKERWNVDDEGEIADLLGVEFTRDGTTSFSLSPPTSTRWSRSTRLTTSRSRASSTRLLATSRWTSTWPTPLPLTSLIHRIPLG